MKHLRLAIAVIISISALLCLFPMTAGAYTDPDTAQIEAVRVFRHMLEPDDMLMIARYDITWGNTSAQPEVAIDQTFNFVYTTAAGNVTGNETASSLFNYGYAKGLVAFYWAADETHPTWENLGNITIVGTPAYGNQTYYTYNMQTADYTPYSLASEIREDLRQWTISQLQFINWDWNQWFAENNYSATTINLLAIFDTYTVLDGSGEAYMKSVNANFEEFCPQLFLFQLANYDYESKEWTLAQKSIYEATHTGSGDLVDTVESGLVAMLGGHIAAIWLTTLVTCLAAGALIVATNYWWLQAKIGALGGYLIFLVATPEGFFQMGVTALIAVLAVIYIVYTFFWKRSSG